jgi:PAS domain S-box-containing protein
MLEEEVSERKRIERHMRAAKQVLRLMTDASCRQEFLDGLIDSLKDWTGCRCIGIRILDNEGNIPYGAYTGFDLDFWKKENWLSISRDSCACTRVIAGNPEPQDSCCMTEKGSFLLNDSRKLLESLSEEELSRFRGVCIQSGFLSIAVVPIFDNGDVVGGIHVADERAGMVPESEIQFLEGLSRLIGEGIIKFTAKGVLEKKQEVLENIVNLIPVMLCSFGADGHPLFVNPEFERLLGWSVDNAQKTDLLAECCPDEERRREAMEYIAKGTAEWREFQIRAKSGEIVDSAWSNVILKDGSHIGIGIDLRERKRVEEELKAYMKKLQESNRALQEFASIASHDMQEPLRKILTFGRMLHQQYGEALGDKGGDYLKRMQSSAERMQTLLEALLDYARVTTRINPFIPVDLTELIREVLEDLDVRVSQSGGTVEVGSLPEVQGDRSQMRQLFQNLIGNALKYRGRNKPVVRVYGENGSGVTPARIYVEDNGIGFEEKYLDRIFQPFQRLHGRSEYEGTGMGLAICRKIVERHGGSITARSRPGEGSTFIVELSTNARSKD